MPLEKALGTEVWAASFIADRLDIPNLNVFVALRRMIRPDDTAYPGFAPVGHDPHAFGSDHFVHSESRDLLAVAQRELYLHPSRRTFHEPVQDVRGT